MLNKKTILKIYKLKDEGCSKRGIAKELKIGRNTVRRYLKKSQLSIQKAAIYPTMPSKFDPYNDLINQLLQDNPTVSAKVVFNQLKEAGFDGESNIVNHLLRKKRNKLSLKIQRELSEANIKLELYRCMISGKSYLHVISKIIEGEINNKYPLNDQERSIVIQGVCQGKNKIWRFGVVVEMAILGIYIRKIARLLDMSRNAVRRTIKKYNEHGFQQGIKHKFKNHKAKEESELKKKQLIEILHQKPKFYNIIRSNWSQPSLAEAYEKKYGKKISRSTVGRLIRKSGYDWKKAKRVLTSPDPNYREKVELLLKTLQSLKPDEMFFFLDEMGPIRVKKHGGRCYVEKEKQLTLPKNPVSKGSVTLFAALSATTNQVTWNFGKSKDTSSMIDIIEILFNQYHEMSKLYLTWDAASWHRSNELIEWLDVFNAKTKEMNIGPIIDVIPLPICAQFLDVIESVFSGMKRAVIHHSDYQSEDEMKIAISGHFNQRNEYFKENPRRAGKKIWEIDFFLDYNNIRSGNYREY